MVILPTTGQVPTISKLAQLVEFILIVAVLGDSKFLLNTTVPDPD